jgi:hypothetical protein
VTKIKIPMHGVVANDKEIGLGDAIKKLTDALHIHLEKCDCTARQRWLNGKVVFTGRDSGLRRNQS